MKKAIKTLAVISALSLVFSAFTACSITGDENPTETTVTTASTTEATTEQTTEEETTTEATETTTEAEVDTIETLLDLIKTFPVGTAGSSSKSVDIALRLINFAESCENTAEVETAVEKLEDTLSDREEAMFEEGFAEIDYVARKLIEGTDTYNGYLENTTAKYNKGNYSLEKYEAIFELISEI